MTSRLGPLAVLTTMACTLVIVVKVATAPAAPPRRTATAAERAQVASVVASEEGNWTKTTTQNFPADRWSQGDDFHSLEARRVEELSKQKTIRIEDILRGVDDDIHRTNAKRDSVPDGRNARAVPCKPRPFYD